MTIIRMNMGASLLIVVVVIIRKVFANRISQRMVMSLWGIVAVKLILPLYIPISFAELTHEGVFRVNHVDLNYLNFEEYASYFNVTQQYTDNSFNNIFLIIWFVGIILVLGRFVFLHVKWGFIRKSASPVENRFILDFKQKRIKKSYVSIKQGDYVQSPVTYGVLSPVILLPYNIANVREIELECMLLHEYAHICRYDIAKKYLLVAITCLHWFNPFVWVMYLLVVRDIEIACDEAVLCGADETRRKEYANVLVSFAERNSVLPQSQLGFGWNIIEERIVAIMRRKKMNITSLIAFTVALFVFFTCTVAVSADVNSDSSTKRESAGTIPVEENRDIGSASVSDNSLRNPDGIILDTTPNNDIVFPIEKSKLMRVKTSSLDFITENEASVYAIQSGEVIYANKCGRWGYQIRVKQTDGYVAVYSHLKLEAQGTKISVGDTVSAGDTIGFTGNSGFAVADEFCVSIILFEDENSDFKNTVPTAEVESYLKGRRD